MNNFSPYFYLKNILQKKIYLLLAFGLMFTIQATQAQTIRYVKPGGTGNGSSWSAASGDLQAMINASADGDEVWVAAGTYYPDESAGQTNNDRNASFSMKNGVSILGGFPDTGAPTLTQRNPTTNPTILSGDIDKNNLLDDGNSYQVISNGGGLTNTAVLDGFVITRGNAKGANETRFGGGVLNNGFGSVCSPSFRNCTFQGNNANSGGAMYNFGDGGGTSSPQLTNCTFQGNNTTNGNGGAMFNSGNGGISSPQLTNCTFQGNTASNGGAMFNSGSGGISSPQLTNCTFQGNTASYGGAMFNYGVNSGTISPQLTNCTLQGNNANRDGTIYNDGFAGTVRLILTNCIAFGNSNTFFNSSNALITATYSMFQPGTTGVDVSGNGNLFIDPLFVDAANGDLRLQAQSCAINAGSNAAVPATLTTDLAGNPRIYNSGIVDMGAYEYQGEKEPYSPPVITTNNALNFDGTNDFVSLSTSDLVNCTNAPLTLSTALTIEYWFKGTNIQSAVRFQNSTGYISAGYGTTGSFKHILSNSGGTNGVLVGAAATDGNWHHVAMTWQKGATKGFKSYLDGQLVEEKDATPTDLPTFSSGMFLGSFNGTDEFMNGSLDEVRIWNVARTQAELQAGLCGSLSLPQTDLLMYYKFDHGVANGNNAGSDKLLNSANENVYTGTLNGFALDASSSNWVAPANQTIRYVKAGGTGNGSSWAEASGDLQAMINASCVQQVWVAAGTYYPDESAGKTDNDRNAFFSMKNGVSILGGFPATGTPTLTQRNPTTNPTILSGDIDKNNVLDDGNSLHVINNSGGLTNTAVLDGFVITGGNANNGTNDNRFGGGVLNNGFGSVCSPSFLNCTFQGNYAAFGGAMFNSGIGGGTSSPQLTNCIFQENNADRGGAIYNSPNGGGISSPQLTNCIFQGNNADRGGAMYNSPNGGGTSSPQLTNCTFKGNYALRQGGAMFNFADINGTSSPQLTNCTFQGNNADRGGAMLNDGFGGTVSLKLTNCIVFGNSNPFENLNNASIIANNSLFAPGTTGVDANGTGNLFIDPLFVDAANADLRLQAQSCAINAGSNAAVPVTLTTDLAGNPRIYNNGTVDMGAYEFQGTKQVFTPPATTTNNALNFDGTNDFVSLSAVNLANCTNAPLTLSTTLTIEYWFKGSNIQSAVRFQNGSDFISAGWGTAGNFKHILSNSGGSDGGVVVGAAATDGNWHHVAMTWQRGATNGFKSYLDGKLVDQRDATTTDLPTFSSGMFLGSFNGTGEFMNGSLDEVRVWNVARTQTQIQENLCGDLSLPQTDLLMYYKFDHGTANGSNVGSDKLLNSANASVYTGTLNGFALDGTSSNWVNPQITQPIRYVKQGGTGNGTSWADASGDLQAMINTSCVQQVWVAAGTYKPGTTSSASFSMKAGVKIYGGFPATGNPTFADRNWKTNKTILSGDLNGDDVIMGSGNTLSITNNRENSIHVIDNYFTQGLTNANSLLDGFTITGAYASDDNGGGMSNNNASPSLNNIIFTGNYSRFGGGMANIDSSPKLSNVTFAGNLAGNGGGIYNVRSSASLSNVTFSGNYATNNGGGVYNSQSAPILTNVTFFGNEARNNGGGMYNLSNSAPVVKNSIFWANKKDNAISSTEGDAAIVTYSDIEQAAGVYAGVGNINQDPLFVNTSDFRLQSCSPAINAGTNTGAPATDMLGNARPFVGIVSLTDMGAYEYQGNPVTKPIASTTTGVICVGNPIHLSASGGTSFSWAGPASFSSTAQSPSFTASSTSFAGVYTVSVSNQDCSLTATNTVSVQVISQPTAQISPSTTQTICQGQALNLTANGGGAYAWSGPNFSSANAIASINTSSTTFSGVYKVMVGTGICTATATVSVKINSSITVSVGFAPICLVGNPLNLSASGGDAYRWRGPNGFSSTSASPIKAKTVAKDEGIYSVTVTGNGVCTATSTIRVFYGIGAGEITIANRSPYCKGGPISLTATAAGGSTYRWSKQFGSVNFTGNPVTITTNAKTSDGGLYILFVTGENGCIEKQETLVTVSQVSCVGTRLASEEVDEIDMQINAYPNPVTNILTVEVTLQKPSKLSLSLFNSVGKESGTWQLNEESTFHKTELNMSELTGGVYLLQAQAGKQKVVKRVVKIQY